MCSQCFATTSDAVSTEQFPRRMHFSLYLWSSLIFRCHHRWTAFCSLDRHRIEKETTILPTGWKRGFNAIKTDNIWYTFNIRSLETEVATGRKSAQLLVGLPFSVKNMNGNESNRISISFLYQFSQMHTKWQKLNQFDAGHSHYISSNSFNPFHFDVMALRSYGTPFIINEVLFHSFAVAKMSRRLRCARVYRQMEMDLHSAMPQLITIIIKNVISAEKLVRARRAPSPYLHIYCATLKYANPFVVNYYKTKWYIVFNYMFHYLGDDDTESNRCALWVHRIRYTCPIAVNVCVSAILPQPH